MENYKKKRVVFIVLIIFLSIFLIKASSAEAITREELLDQIARLQVQIAELEKRLTELQLMSPVKQNEAGDEIKSQRPEYDDWCYDFLTDLKYQQKGESVKALQAALEREGLFKGSVTGYFGPITFQAVKLFQEKYFNEILAPWGFKRGTGFVGHTTRAKLNELYGCAKIYTSPVLPQQGDALVVKIETNFSPEEVKGNLGLKKIDFSRIDDYLVGIIGISTREKPGKYNLSISFPDNSRYQKTINIIERKFPVTELLVTEELEEKGFSPSKIQERVREENMKLMEVLNIFTPRAYFDNYFIYPLEKIKDVGAFGNIRKSGNVSLQHLGVDLEADTGTPIYAINDGVIRLSQEFINYGKIIAIDHGLGIFSIYLHLDEFKVFEGETVKRGEIIGLSGNTGYSIAPHLHLGTKIKNVSVDPLRFIEEMRDEI